MNVNLEEVMAKVDQSMHNIVSLSKCFQNGTCEENTLAIIIGSLKILRNSCSKGKPVQCEIIKIFPTIYSIYEQINCSMFDVLNDEQKKEISTIIWQLIANIIVQNVETQKIVWENYGNQIKESLKSLSPYTNIQIAVLYNITKGQSIFLDPKDIFKILIQVWSNVLNEKNDCNLEFLHIFMEYYLCNISCRIVPIYATLESEEKITALKYIVSYIRNESPNGQIQKILMEYISKEFKKKSDCILRVNDERLNEMYPYEVMTLIEVISIASGDSQYSHIYEKDHSLFLNVGGLLHTINELGKKSNNTFTPMEKLIQVAPNSNIDKSFENEISYHLRTYLVRTLANLLYKNKKNQEYVRELNIIAAILDSSRTDARNPLIKEWSILAIRNMCENCPENQEIIKNMTKVGNASNEILTELNLQMGSLRINPNL